MCFCQHVPSPLLVGNHFQPSYVHPYKEHSVPNHKTSHLNSNYCSSYSTKAVFIAWQTQQLYNVTDTA